MMKKGVKGKWRSVADTVTTGSGGRKRKVRKKKREEGRRQGRKNLRKRQE